MTTKLPDWRDREPTPQPLALKSNEGFGPTPTLVERLRTRPTGDPYLHMMVHEAADEIERLRTAISIVREYPDFDSGGALPEMMDQVLRGLPAPMLDTLDLLGLGPNS